MKKLLFIDRDGTILQEPEDEQIDSPAKLRFMPGVITWLGRIARELDYVLVMVSNQDGLGTAAFPETDFLLPHTLMLDVLTGEGILFDDVLIDRSFPADKLPTRKPGTAMLRRYQTHDYDMVQSFVIGDRPTDVELAHNLGCGSILIGEQTAKGASFQARHWREIFTFLKGLARRVHVRRASRETDISMHLDIDGEGIADIRTGLGFLDHMLELLCFHGGFNLKVQALGDLHVDEHHTIEDCALALGEAFDRAAGSRKGIGRYGFCLPMDESLARVVLDFGGRPGLVWQADFSREKVGDVPTEMFSHFFKSFGDKARCTIHIRAEGSNEHHKVEAIFKAFARALGMALRRDGRRDGLSTKGIV